MENTTKISRKDNILQSLAQMLETQPGARITTAALAREVGVSEAALYRHFPSKARMFEGLIQFIEDTLFARIARLAADEGTAETSIYNIFSLLLTFCDRNPGMTRLLTGDALNGENDRLRERISQFYARLESQIKQVLREAQIRENLKPSISAAALTSLLLAAVEGRLAQFVRSEFKQSPLEHWDIQWPYLSANLMMPFGVDDGFGSNTPA
jgi:TetR/AcrR family transcriptional regulator